MIVVDFQCLPSSKAREVYNKLNDEARFIGLVSSIENLVIVSDPESVLSENERRIITTGLEDERLRATYDLMSLQLRFVL